MGYDERSIAGRANNDMPDIIKPSSGKNVFEEQASNSRIDGWYNDLNREFNYLEEAIQDLAERLVIVMGPSYPVDPSDNAKASPVKEQSEMAERFEMIYRRLGVSTERVKGLIQRLEI